MVRYFLLIAVLLGALFSICASASASPSSDLGVIRAEVAASPTLPAASQALDQALLQTAQMYLALPGGLGRPGACLLIAQFQTQATNQVVFDSNAILWVTQVAAVRTSIPC